VEKEIQADMAVLDLQVPLVVQADLGFLAKTDDLD